MAKLLLLKTKTMKVTASMRGRKPRRDVDGALDPSVRDRGAGESNPTRGRRRRRRTRSRRSFPEDLFQRQLQKQLL